MGSQSGTAGGTRTTLCFVAAGAAGINAVGYWWGALLERWLLYSPGDAGFF